MEKKEESNGTSTLTKTSHRPKKRGTLGIVWASIFTVRRCSSSKKGPKSPKAADGMLKSLVDGMRPLHLQLGCRPPLPLLPPPPPAGHESFHDVFPPPSSPACSSNDGMSRYASAEDLQALDVDTTEGNDGSTGANGVDEGEASHTIDTRAEEFIARFYEQMRLQRLDSQPGH
ncbi:hypothetical protein OPV22_035121 [Ensete ventricosum]|uniref:DUF761 domain-containing protein n=1 Tax=Ensete ventricosum TaxID=4639 RepID=A0AAX5KEY8_ENSVE|nr:hypothetical protein OPV22_035121 [Ensete ventricosum]